MVVTTHCHTCKRDVEIEDDATAFCPVCSSPLILQLDARPEEPS